MNEISRLAFASPNYLVYNDTVKERNVRGL
jgi:hypothetical protein